MNPLGRSPAARLRRLERVSERAIRGARQFAGNRSLGLAWPLANLRHMVLPMAAVSDWVAALGGLGVFAATAWLAFVATEQMASAQDQIDASIEQGKQIREAARAQLQPIVFAVFTQSYVFGPDDGLDLVEGQIGFPYHLTNEGDGVALRVRHGVEIDGQDFEPDGVRELRSLRAGETYPPAERVPNSGKLVDRPWLVVKAEHELPAEWNTRSRNYWVEFENVFGDRFERLNPTDPAESTTFRRLPSE